MSQPTRIQRILLGVLESNLKDWKQSTGLGSKAQLKSLQTDLNEMVEDHGISSEDAQVINQCMRTILQTVAHGNPVVIL
jgi:hypothetical protein